MHGLSTYEAIAFRIDVRAHKMLRRYREATLSQLFYEFSCDEIGSTLPIWQFAMLGNSQRLLTQVNQLTPADKELCVRYVKERGSSEVRDAIEARLSQLRSPEDRAKSFEDFASLITVLRHPETGRTFAEELDLDGDS